MQFRFLHVSDVHLGFRQYNESFRASDFAQAFRDVIDRSIAAKVDFAVKRDAAGTVMIRWVPEIKYCDTRMSPAALREVRLALLEADVHYSVVKKFTSGVRERAVGSEVSRALNPAPEAKNKKRSLITL